ncbi:MAG: ribonuclease H-like domain-containing protein [Desulfobacca sp.]|uniref:ribonuclease H-like domain-containing protein n=1 Tax=Desulfobacca sp. TaxID=2067990 RepID=UPI004048FF01
MLKRTFIHLARVGPATERHLWRQGIETWEDLLAARHVPGVHPGRLAAYQRQLEDSLAHLDQAIYFSRRLPAAERWRLFQQYRSRTAYLDIETTGASWPHLTVTVIGLFDGRNFQQFVLGQNLQDFLGHIDAFQMLVTFNGSQFDLPVLQAVFGRVFSQAHIDLRFVLARLGFKGGLKKIEPHFGLQRPTELEGLDGYDAVLLWQRARRGDVAALDTLLAYNREDVINLETLMEQAYHLAARRTLALLPVEKTTL